MNLIFQFNYKCLVDIYFSMFAMCNGNNVLTKVGSNIHSFKFPTVIQFKYEIVATKTIIYFKVSNLI